MTDQERQADDSQSNLQEAYLKNLEELEEGQLVTGTIIEISPENVFVDIGYKSEGKIPLEEFETEPEIGDTVNVVLLKKEGRSGEVVVSKRKADVKVFWKDLKKIFQDRTPVKGKVVKAIKGGFEVELSHGVRAFNPISRIDIVRVEDQEKYVGLESFFIIERLYSDNKVKLIVSRRTWLEEDIAKRRDEFFEKVEIGDEVEGVVKSFTSFGAFIDLGGFDGLLHINDMSWGHVTRPKDFVKKGQKIKFKLINKDPEEKKINLSLKHFTQDPWETFTDHYDVDMVVKAKVTKLTDFGAFIELEEGIEGLAHISELSWVKRIKHPKELLNIGDEVEAKVLGYDLDAKKVSLGLKQVCPNPWDTIEQKYPEGMKLTKKIVKITNAGAFIELEEGIDGFLHVDDVSWTRKVKNMSSIYNEGDEIEVVVTRVDTENRRIRLGVKQLSDDPWAALKGASPKGSIIEGEVTNVTDFGIFVRVTDSIEGLVSKNQLSNNYHESLDELLKEFNEGDKVKALVMDINPGAQKLSLSIKEYQKSLQREELSKYIHDEDETTASFADFVEPEEGEE